MDNDAVKNIIKRLGKMKSDRAAFQSLWQEIADHAIPRRANILSETNEGERHDEEIFDSTAAMALDDLAAGLVNLMTNPAVRWFKMKVRNPDLMKVQEVKKWLAEVEDLIADALEDSNFYMVVHEIFLDLAGLGTAALFMPEGDQSLVAFSARNPAEVYVAENKDGMVDTVFRVYRATARQAAQETKRGVAGWKEESFSDALKTAIKDDPDKKFDFLHAVFPRADADEKKAGGKNLPWVNMYIEMSEAAKDGKLLFEGGFHEFPYAVPRWSKMSGEKFGRSRLALVLADVQMLNKMSETSIRYAEKAADPPVQMPDEGFSNVDLDAGGVSVYDPDNEGRIEPIGTGSDLRLTLEMEQHRRESVKRALYVNLLLQFDQEKKRMTATEIIERSNEIVRLMGPILGRFQNELLRVIIDRVYGIISRAIDPYTGRPKLPAIPKVMADVGGSDLKINYINPIAQAQKSAEAQAVVTALGALAPLVQVWPSIVDNYDPDAIVKVINESYGVPAVIQRNEKVIKVIREERDQMEAEERKKREMAEALQFESMVRDLGAVPGNEEAA